MEAAITYAITGVMAPDQTLGSSNYILRLYETAARQLLRSRTYWASPDIIAESTETLTSSDLTATLTQTTPILWRVPETAARDLPRPRTYWASPDIIAESTDSEQIFDTIQALYLGRNGPRDRQIAGRITVLHRDALAEDERIRPASLSQFADFLLSHPDLGVPKITLTPDGTLRARWIRGQGNFAAIEFTGEPLAKMVAEIPRDNDLTAHHFITEPIQCILTVARAIGASFR